jgi:hypothetical protein
MKKIDGLCVTFVDSKLYDPSLVFPGTVVVVGPNREGSKEKFLKKPARLAHVFEILSSILSPESAALYASPEPEMKSNLLKELKVLLAEDNTMNQIVIRKLLIQIGSNTHNYYFLRNFQD